MFALDTRVLFDETLRVLGGGRGAATAPRSRCSRPQDPPDRLWETDPAGCCGDPQGRRRCDEALSGLDAWITGMRREQSPTRSDIAEAGWDDKHGLWKFNPLADWTERDVWAYIVDHGLPYHPLHDGGYASIGCAHCTQPGTRARGSLGGEREDRVRPARLSHLDHLESEAVHVMREVAAERERPALLFSGGKDSIVLLRLAEKAFRPGRFPFPLLHVDTGHNFPEVIEFRDRRVAELGEQLLVASVRTRSSAGRIVEERRRALRATGSDDDAARRDRGAPLRRPASAARAATRSTRGRRNVVNALRDELSGPRTHGASARSWGTSPTRACTRRAPAPSSRCRTRPSSTSPSA